METKAKTESLKLYHIETIPWAEGLLDDALVCAKNKEAAILMCEFDNYFIKSNNDLSVTEIGTANKDQKEGIIFTSYPQID